MGTHAVRVSLDSRRAAKKLRIALAPHLVEEDEAELALVLTAPAGFQRNHVLTDCGGITLSEGRGLDAGLRALAEHLAVLVRPPVGVVRVGARALVSESKAVLCAEPLLHFPSPDREALAALGFRLIDRLAVDIDSATGQMVVSPNPWPDLRPRVGDDIPTRVPISTILSAGDVALPPSRATVIAQILARLTFGTPAEGLSALAAAIDEAEIVVTDPFNVLSSLRTLA